jgi:lipopolysaccharide assembly protein A
MQIVRTIAWVLLTAVLVLFAVANWKPVEILIWTTLVLETKLPVLVVGAFLLGLVPMWLAHRIILWRLRRHALSPQSAPEHERSAPPHAGETPISHPA